MIVGLVMDQDGRPLCSELWPGNTADVTTLLPVVDRLCARFGVGRICVVADRGMISAETIAGLEQCKLEYVLGVRERSSAEVRSTVLDDRTPFVPLAVPRASGALTELEAKQVNTAKKDILAILEEINKLGKRRDAAVHSLDILLTDVDGTKMSVNPRSDHRLSKDLRGKSLLTEFDYYSRWAEKMSMFVIKAENALTFGDYTWPDRPSPPDRRTRKALLNREPHRRHPK